MTGITYLTPQGMTKLEEELAHLVTVRRAEVADRLHEAVEEGELTENAEYESAKTEQAFVEGRIMELEMMLANSELIDQAIANGTVQLGSEVHLQEVGDPDVEIYRIVGAVEANPLEGLISNESPMGKALIGKKAKNKITISAPAGELTFKILEVN